MAAGDLRVSLKGEGKGGGCQMPGQGGMRIGIGSWAFFARWGEGDGYLAFHAASASGWSITGLPILAGGRTPGKFSGHNPPGRTWRGELVAVKLRGTGLSHVWIRGHHGKHGWRPNSVICFAGNMSGEAKRDNMQVATRSDGLVTEVLDHLSKHPNLIQRNHLYQCISRQNLILRPAWSALFCDRRRF